MARMIDADKLIDQIERKYGMDPMYFTDDNTPEGRQAIIDAALIELLERAANEEARKNSIDADSLKDAFTYKETLTATSLEYKSPISIIYHEMETQIKQTVEGKVFAAVGDVGIDIDREGLIRAIEADRKVQEGKLVEVVRCKDCKYGKEIHTGCARAIMCTNDDVPFVDENGELYVDFDWSCPLGERRQDNGEIH